MKAFALGFLGLGSPLILLALLFGGPAGEWVLVGVGLLFPVALAAAATAGAPRFPSLGRWLLALAVALLVSGAGVMLTTGGGRPGGAGLPPAAKWALAGLGLAPLVLVALGHALTFDAAESRRDDP